MRTFAPSIRISPFDVLLLSAAFLVITALLSGCDFLSGTSDSHAEDEEEGGSSGISYPYLPEDGVAVNGAQFDVEVFSTGAIRNGTWSGNGALYYASLWVAREDAGEASASVAWVGSPTFSNMEARLGERATGVYYVTPDSLGREGDGWPADLGAPTVPDGDPELMGDVMAWQALFPAPDPAVQEMSRPVEGLRIEQTVFAHRNQQYKDVFFVRYRLTNTTDHPMNDLHTGLYSDTDIGVDYGVCGTASANATGYDVGQAVTYTYPYSARTDDDCEPVVVGFSFLSTPHGGDVPSAVQSHRIMRKNDYVDVDFSEHTVVEPRQFLYALQGLSNEGEPMVNPVTGETTRFAFDGNPVTGDGWLDTPIDVRSLLSLKPFDIAAGESAELTAVFAAGRGSSLNQAIPMVIGPIADLRENTTAWSR